MTSALYEDEKIDSYMLDFGDGSNVTGMNVTHNFTTSAVFPVNLTVIDDDGETWSIQYPVSPPDVTLYINPCNLSWNATLGMIETAGKLPINVTITNNGVLTETFTVKVYANITAIGTQNVIILGGASKNLTFHLSASELEKGNYNISVYVAGETEYAANLIKVYLTGDVDRNDCVDIFDIVAITGSYGSYEGDGGYDVRCDLDCDGKIEIFDVVMGIEHYGECL